MVGLKENEEKEWRSGLSTGKRLRIVCYTEYL